MSTEHKAIQIREKNGRPTLVRAGVQIGTDIKGKEIWKTLLCEIWELDGYETVIPQGYVPYYSEKVGKWLRTPVGSDKDPNNPKQQGFILDNSIPF